MTKKKRRKVKITTRDVSKKVLIDRKNIPSNYFLDSKNKRYPYKTARGIISCKALRDAMRLAGMRKDKTILNKAKNIYNRYCKK